MNTSQFLSQAKKLNPKLDILALEKAADFAGQTYGELKRTSGQSYLDHCFDVALCLAKMKLDQATISAAILHETVDKAGLNKETLKKEFGADVAFLVESLADVTRLKTKKTKENADKFRKLFLAMAKDIRVILIKLANQLYNLKTLNALSQSEQKRISLQILEIYAPLADRLGLGELKGQLEDLAFPFAFPKEYFQIIEQIKEKRGQRENYLKRTIPLVKKILNSKGIKLLELQTRAKHYYSLYKKLAKHDFDWNRIYDLSALRIFVPDIENCYAALGAIHAQWKPLAGLFDDYVAVPKSNGYQSLHTTVFCEQGKIVEFQIRTPKMHEQAEYGIASHLAYDEQGKRSVIPSKKFQKEITWLKQLREWQEQHFASEQEFVDSLKIDFLQDRIFVFTPKGDVIDLPEGATAIDFAYYVHTDLGHQAVGAKIDGKFSPVATPLKNKQIVEVIREKNKKPNYDWLKFAKTHQAKTKIRAYFNKLKEK